MPLYQVTYYHKQRDNGVKKEVPVRMLGSLSLIPTNFHAVNDKGAQTRAINTAKVQMKLHNVTRINLQRVTYRHIADIQLEA